MTHIACIVTCPDCRTEWDTRIWTSCPICACLAAKREKLNAILPVKPLTEPS